MLDRATTAAYFDRFNTVDALVRNCRLDNCQSEYLARLRAPSAAEAARIASLVKEACAIAHKAGIRHDLFTRPTGWSFLLSTQQAENGYPHTHGDTIILPDTWLKNAPKNLVETILHERVHVYQRRFPVETNILLVHVWGLDMAGLHKTTLNLRANPDTNGLVYALPNKGRDDAQDPGGILSARYGDKARTLADVLQPNDASAALPKYAQRDHPYEWMASIIAHLIVVAEPSTEREHQALQWMRSHLSS